MFYTEKTVSRLLEAKDAEINLLRHNCTYLQQEATRERQRAELAVDRLLALTSKNTVPSVMPEVVHIPTDEERAEHLKQVQEMKSVRAALESVGDIGSDPDTLEIKTKVKEEIA